jgi:predicted GNAT family acetyltransferase
MSELVDNKQASRFELHIDGMIVFADYRRQGQTLILDWVEAPPALRGTGAAHRLMRGITERARAENWEIVPICGYAASWLRQNADRAARVARSQ